VTSSVRLVKRVVDIALASVGLAVTLPLYPAIMASIYAESPGPVFFRQRRAGKLRRVGAGGRDLQFDEFEMVKFRTMSLETEKGRPQFDLPNAKRVTRMGKVLRRTRLDELPQLWNILRGDMSLVGPRPERPEILRDLALAIPYFEERVREVKPGLTGFAQVNLGYSGEALPGTAVKALEDSLTNPFKLPEAEGALADDMRIKLLFDLAYCASLENLGTFLRMEASVLAKTPVVMLKGIGR
jgi:lipopolysaccharide/colanic/teichoic acid biosynthesis glycosyltransferase